MRKIPFLLVFVLSSAYSVLLPAEQILHYNFDPQANYYVASGLIPDLSFHGYNGIVVGNPTYTAGGVAGALYFDNPTGEQTATQYIALPDLTNALRDSSYTIAIKYKSNDTSGGNGALFGNNWSVESGFAWNINSYNRPAPNGLISQLPAPPNVPYGYFEFGSFAPNGTPNTADGQWHRAVLSVDRTAQTLDFYLDGRLMSHAFDATPEHNSIPNLGVLTTSFANLTLGAVKNAGYGAKAAVDDFQVFNTALTAAQVSQLSDLHPTNNNPANQLRFSTPAQAEAKRRQLVNYIWSEGLPTSSQPNVVANVAFPNAHLAGVDTSLVASIDKLDADVGGMDLHAISYLLHPKNTANSNRLLIVQQGHQDGLLSGLDSMTNKALQAGYTVIAMNMPMTGWNTDNTLNVPGQGTITIGQQSYEHSHNELFAQLAHVFADGTAFRFFLEPVVQNINYFKTLTDGAGDVTMTGISGGGWTTHLAAAIDPRITLSVPVAGSAPLFARDQYFANSMGDAEQDYAPMFAEDIAADGSGGGVATWEEIYALGGFGAGRKQVMVTNLYDDICFSGTFADSFKDIVAGEVAELGAGVWEYYLDPNTVRDFRGTTHVISEYVQDSIVLANMAAPEPSTLVLAAVAAAMSAAMLLKRRRKARV